MARKRILPGRNGFEDLINDFDGLASSMATDEEKRERKGIRPYTSTFKKLENLFKRWKNHRVFVDGKKGIDATNVQVDIFILNGFEDDFGVFEIVHMFAGFHKGFEFFENERFPLYKVIVYQFVQNGITFSNPNRVQNIPKSYSKQTF